MFQRGKTIMRIKSMMKGMLAVVMAMSMAASDYLGAIADEDYVKALPSNSYEDRGGAVLDGPEAGYKVTYTQADAEEVTAEYGRAVGTGTG